MPLCPLQDSCQIQLLPRGRPLPHSPWNREVSLGLQQLVLSGTSGAAGALQGLSAPPPQRDPIVAKQLFVSLFSGILKETDKSKAAAERLSIAQQLLQDLTRFLGTTFSFFPPFVSCIQVRLRPTVRPSQAGISAVLLTSLGETRFSAMDVLC